MIRSSPSQLYKKNSCSVNPEDGSFNQKIPVEDFIFNKFASILL